MLMPKEESMPDDASSSSEQSSPSHAGHIPITEEMDSAKWTLPPMGTVLGVAVVLAIVIVVMLFATRSQPAAAIAITKVATAEMDGNTMVAVQVKIDNQVEKPLWIKNI